MVALLMEGVDRNLSACDTLHKGGVALLMEGVDRNTGKHLPPVIAFLSPSSWRAWIEIWMIWTSAAVWTVALLMEGVDRNKRWRKHTGRKRRSPSSWRAWIEIRNLLKSTAL